MKLTISKTTTKTETIEVPKYWKTKGTNHYYKFLNEKYCVQVSLYSDWGTSIGIVSISVGFGGEYVVIDENMYIKAITEAITILCGRKNESL